MLLSWSRSHLALLADEILVVAIRARRRLLHPVVRILDARERHGVAHPGLLQVFRILDSHVVDQLVAVATEALGHLHVVTVDVALRADPALIVEAFRNDHERITVPVAGWLTHVGAVAVDRELPRADGDAAIVV